MLTKKPTFCKENMNSSIDLKRNSNAEYQVRCWRSPRVKQSQLPVTLAGEKWGEFLSTFVDNSDSSTTSLWIVQLVGEKWGNFCQFWSVIYSLIPNCKKNLRFALLGITESCFNRLGNPDSALYYLNKACNICYEMEMPDPEPYLLRSDCYNYLGQASLNLLSLLKKAKRPLNFCSMLLRMRMPQWP